MKKKIKITIVHSESTYEAAGFVGTCKDFFLNEKEGVEMVANLTLFDVYDSKVFEKGTIYKDADNISWCLDYIDRERNLEMIMCNPPSPPRLLLSFSTKAEVDNITTPLTAQ